MVSERRKGGRGEKASPKTIWVSDAPIWEMGFRGFRGMAAPFFAALVRLIRLERTSARTASRNEKAACIVQTTAYHPVSSSAGQACRFVGSELLPLGRARSYRHARPPLDSNVVTGLPPLSSSLPSLTHPPQDVLLLPTSSTSTILAVLQRLCISVWFARSRRRRRRRGTGDVQELYTFASRFEPFLPSSSSLSLFPMVSSRVAGRD